MQARTVAPARAIKPAELGQVQVTVPQAGVVLGRDRGGRPVQLGLFGPRPLAVVFIGGWWAAQVVALRCLAHGALILVDAVPHGVPAQTGTVATLGHWLALERAARGRVRPAAGAGVVRVPTDPAVSVADAGHPLLRLHDPGPGGQPGRVASGPWQTHLTAYARITPESLHAAAGADLVLVQRVEPAAAAQLGSALLMAPQATAGLPMMDNEMLAAVRSQAIRYLWLTPTALERRLFG
jgi:ESX secretion system protein EccE